MIKKYMPFLMTCLAATHVSIGASLPEKELFHVYLLIGQSNMAGRGKVEEQDRRTHPRVLTLDENNQWIEAVNPIHFDKPAIAGVGPGVSFGKAMAEKNPGVTIGLVPCAVGGTAISQWQKGAPPKKPWGGLYDNAVQRARLALKDGVLKGILWHQGEADCREDKRTAYEERISALVADLRQDLNAPNIPFIAGELGAWGSSGRKAFNRNLKGLPSWIEHSAVVSSEGLNHGGDKTHFDAASQRILGKRYAETMQRLQSGRE